MDLQQSSCDAAHGSGDSALTILCLEQVRKNQRSQLTLNVCMAKVLSCNTVCLIIITYTEDDKK